jgi:hypothetical protein
MYREFDKKKYEIPPETQERFDFLVNKILYAKTNNHVELYRGLLVVLNAEFSKYIFKRKFL